jgi:spore coat polysaccharide biosynthesis protein SpsF
MNVLTVIQARRGSSRLPDKVSMDLCGATLLERMVERVMRAKQVGTVVIATTTDPYDNPIQDICERRGWNCFRGHPTDLLDRHYQAAAAFNADSVVKIPSDVPLIDPAVIDLVLTEALSSPNQYDFVSNLHPGTWPDGMDVEWMSMPVLHTAWKEATLPMEREHTTPFIWERPDRFRIKNVEWPSGLDWSMSHRFTIDYPEDYTFIKTVYEALWPQNPTFGLEDILNLLEQQPEIYTINSRFAGVNWYRNHLDELKTIAEHQTKTLNP